MATADDFRTPGQFISALLDERSWSQAVLGLVLGLSTSMVNRIVADKRAVDAELALMLEEVFGIPAEEFMAVQLRYDFARARISVRPDADRGRRAALFGSLPVAEMITRGWLETDDVKDVARLEAALAKFFGAPSPDAIPVLPHAARKANPDAATSPAQLAWLYRVRAIAADQVVPRYSPAAVREAITKLSALLLSAEEARKVPRILTEAGVRFVVVESLASAKIDGACLWLNDMAPVVGMTLRHDRIDNFWFVLRHELEHVLRGHGRTHPVVDAELEGDRAGTGAGVPEQERVANQAAADFCVPQDQLDRFIARKAPFFAERDILGFASTLKLHPGLVAGQLQHRTRRFDRFRTFLVKVRSLVAPGSAVDGWGDVYPLPM